MLLQYLQGNCYFRIDNQINVIQKLMTPNDKQNERVAQMTFASVYPHYVTKVEKKGRTIAELHQVIEWLTGYDEKKLQELIDQKITFNW